MKNIHILPTDKPSRLHFNEFEELLFTPKYEKLEGVNIYITSDEEIKEKDYYLDKFGIIIKRRPVKNNRLMPCDGNWVKKIILTTDLDLIKDGVQAIDDEFLEWFVKNPSCEEVEVEMNQGRYFDYGGNIHITNAYKIIIPKEEPKQSIKDRIMSETSEEIKQKAMDYGNSLVTKQKTLNINKNTHYVDFSNPNADKISSASTTTIKKEALEEAAKIHAFNFYEKEDREVGEQSFIAGAKWQQEQDDKYFDKYMKSEKVSQIERIAKLGINTTGQCFEQMVISLIIQQEQDKNKYSEEEVSELVDILQKCKEYFLLKIDLKSEERADAIGQVLEKFKNR